MGSAANNPVKALSKGRYHRQLFPVGSNKSKPQHNYFLTVSFRQTASQMASDRERSVRTEVLPAEGHQGFAWREGKRDKAQGFQDTFKAIRQF